MHDAAAVLRQWLAVTNGGNTRHKHQAVLLCTAYGCSWLISQVLHLPITSASTLEGGFKRCSRGALHLCRRRVLVVTALRTVSATLSAEALHFLQHQRWRQFTAGGCLETASGP